MKQNYQRTQKETREYLHDKIKNSYLSLLTFEIFPPRLKYFHRGLNISTPVEIFPPGLYIPTWFKYLHPGLNIPTWLKYLHPGLNIYTSV